MASRRRNSDGDSTSRSRLNRFNRSLSRARKLFRNTDHIDNMSDTARSVPLEPQVKTKNRRHRSRSISNESAGSDNESVTGSMDSFKEDVKQKGRFSRSERSEKDKQSMLEIQHLEYTRNNPLGSALLDIVADNLALHKKLKFKKTNLRVADLCTAFHDHMELEKDKLKKELATSSAETELKILDKELHAYRNNENLSPPSIYSSKNILNSAHARSEAIRIFPTKNKYNGTENASGMNIHEFLSLVNAAQKQIMLSREEFLEFLLMCTTGKPHVLIQDWADNGDDIENIYINLFSHYDHRMAPETAREKLSAYKARKNSNLNKTVADIMQLALRAASTLPQGVARTASYNSEAVQALIRSLPPVSSDVASNKYFTISSRFQRPATFAELSRALAINAHTIDNEIAKLGAPPNYSTFGSKNFHSTGGNGAYKSNRDKKSKPSGNAAYAVNVNPANKRGNNRLNPPNKSASARHVQQSRQPNAYYNQNPSTNSRNSTGRGRNDNNGSTRANNGSTRNNGHTRSGNGNNGNRNSGRYNSNSGSQGFRPRNYCSMCGMKDHLAIDGCPHLVDDMGRPIQAHPCQTTCSECPRSVSPRLNHSAAYCPFRIGGPLHGTK